MLNHEQRCQRLRERLQELSHWRDRDVIALDQWTFDGEPWPLGAPWPRREGVAAIAHGEVEVPAQWPLEHTWLEIDLGGEGLVRLSYDDGSEAGFGLDPNHQRLPLRRRRFAVSAECVARLPFGVPNREARLARAQLVLAEPAVAALIRLFELIAAAAESLSGDDVVEPLLRAAEAAYYRLDWPSATADYVARVRGSRRMQRIWQVPAGLDDNPPGLDEEQHAAVAAAVDELRRDLSAMQQRYPPRGSLALTGHAHIDVAWLWPVEETRRKAVRTFHSAVGLLDDFPEMRFNQSSAQLYHFVEEDDPTLFARIKAKVAAGQWEPVGGMWVEPDTIMPTGESLARQLLYGQRYFERTFGRCHTVCWLPDCFGFSPALPQLLRKAGIDSFFTIKVNWSETNLFPYDLFWWEGLDGSRVLAHTFRNPVGGYNADLGPRAVVETWRAYRGKHDHPESLLSFGYGDGGGGPTREMLDASRDLAVFPALPALRHTTVAGYFERARSAAFGTCLPVWVGEMYLELHRATTTTQGRTKVLHRRAERELIAAEVVASLAAMLGVASPPPSLEAAWRVLLRNQFHDILPGTSIREVYERTEAELAAVVEEAAGLVTDALDRLAETVAAPGGDQALLVVNPELSARPLRIWSAQEVTGAQGVEDGWVMCGATEVAPMSVNVIAAGTPPPDGLSVSARTLENAYLAVTLDDDGRLARVYDKLRRREVLAGPGNQVWAYTDKPRQWDAWDIEADYAQMGKELSAATSVEVIESGPHRAALRVTRPFRDSAVQQDIRLWANSPRLDFHTRIDWHERRVMLKARFPLAVHTSEATFECAFGVQRRATHQNTSWERARFEVAAHRFVDLSEHGFGVALLNDGRYGHDALGNELAITLLRSPTYPDALADEGIHAFTYALYPHGGDCFAGGVLGEADDLNRPLPARSVAAAEMARPVIAVNGRPLALAALKRAEDGDDLILRVYEPAGGRGAVTLAMPEGWRVAERVDIVEKRDGEFDETVRPFEIIGLRLQAVRE